MSQTKTLFVDPRGRDVAKVRVYDITSAPALLTTPLDQEAALVVPGAIVGAQAQAVDSSFGRSVQVASAVTPHFCH